MIQTIFYLLMLVSAVFLGPTSASAAELLDIQECINRLPAPPLADFLKEARPLNLKHSDEELTHAWKDTFKTCSAILIGKIEPADVAPFKDALEKTGRDGHLILTLDSEGGDLAAAIQIGRLVREWQNSTLILLDNHRCFSACVFVLAGGLRRIVSGQVGIHRPFISTTNPSTFESAQKRFRTLEQSAKAFLKTVNVPTSLYDEMMSVPPQKLRLLTEQELARYGIGQNDPVYQDNRDAEDARSYGLKKEEFLYRKERADRICSALSVNEEKVGFKVTLEEAENISRVCHHAIVNHRPRLDENNRPLKASKDRQH